MDGVANMQAADQAELAATRELRKPRTAMMEQPATGNADRIRDILFGPQMRDYEDRFARLEETLAKETADLRETTRRRFDTLEAYIKREIEYLQTRWKTEREERSDRNRRLARDLRDLSAMLGKKLREVDDRVSESHGRLRADLLQQSRGLSEEMQRKHAEVSAALERRFQELRNGKTDRALLAGMLTEMALRLKNEFRMPEAEA